MTCKSKGFAAAVFMAMTAGTPRIAHACSPVLDDGCDANIEVFRGVTERPTNACIRATWSLDDEEPVSDDGGGDAGDVGPRVSATADFVYVAPDGSTVALLPGAMRCPERELAPFTEYAIVGPPACGRGAPIEYGRFTTTAGPDTTPPTLPGPIGSGCWTESCDSSACCGPYVVRVVSSSWGASTDDSGAVLYDAGGFFTPLTSRRGFAVMSGAVMGDAVIGSDGTMARPGGGSNSLIAYDIAGNASEPAEIGTSYPCTEPADPAASCSAQGGRQARPPLGLCLTVGLLVVVRRRRR
jgi:hypothetical protein